MKTSRARQTERKHSDVEITSSAVAQANASQADSRGTWQQDQNLEQAKLQHTTPRNKNQISSEQSKE